MLQSQAGSYQLGLFCFLHDGELQYHIMEEFCNYTCKVWNCVVGRPHAPWSDVPLHDCGLHCQPVFLRSLRVRWQTGLCHAGHVFLWLSFPHWLTHGDHTDHTSV